MNNTGLQLSTQSSMAEWQIIREQATVLVATGFLPQSVKTPEQAMAIILTGRELGIGPMAALQGIDVIQGKPSISPQLMLAMARGTRELEDIQMETSEAGATCTIKRKGQSSYTTRFGPKEAAAMGLNGKDNYKKQPATMYQWRAVGMNLRVTFPDVIKGMYVEDTEPQYDADEDEQDHPQAVDALPVIEPVVIEEIKQEEQPPPPTVATTPVGKQAIALKNALKMSDADFLAIIDQYYSLTANTPAEGADNITLDEQKDLVEKLQAMLKGKK